MRNQSENDDIPQEPENLRFAPIIFFYFAFLIDMIDNIITYSPYSLYSLSPELQPMAMQYTGHVISVCIT